MPEATTAERNDAGRNDLRQFLFTVFVLLVPAFLLWTLASGALAAPAVAAVNALLTHWFPDLVHTLYIHGNQALLMTEFGEQDGRPIPLAGAEYRLGYPVEPRSVTYSLPFYSALHFATRRKSHFESWAFGLLLLYLLVIVGLLRMCLKHLLVRLGNTFLQQPDVFVPGPNLIGIVYQVNVLLVPTVAPALLWLWQNRDSDLLRGLRRGLARAGRGPVES